ncbi:MAG TPA: cbb3-type cytochrome c oxidase subunit I [Planctomycetota bacterium]|nr:cbb3-type cytochrome c oxidase subunit I [Planctomycetota bacterium]
MSEPTSFLRRYVFSTDHKVIGKQYLFTGLFFLLVAGLFAILIRWQIAHPFQPMPVLGHLLSSDSHGVVIPTEYSKLFTMHGSLMVFFAVTPILIGAFGNFIIPLQIGARDMSFPVLNMLSYWVYALGSVAVLSVFFVSGGAASAGWTAYAPLSSSVKITPGFGQTIWIVAIAFSGTSTLLGAINYIATILNERCPGMDLMRMPLTTWGFFYTSILNLLWVPLIAAALFMLVLDRTVGTSFFTAGPLAPRGGGQPLLYQHLFWGFGHPEVYILILPIWGLLGDLLATFSRKPAFGYRATVISMGVIVAVSQVVWGHHMYTAGMNPILGKTFMFLTVSISMPTAIFFFNWLATIWGGAIQLKTPMLFALGVVFVFALGGLTGLFNAVQALDVYIHDTTFVVGHFHYTLAASVFFGMLAGIYFWFPKMFGRALDERLGKVHFAISFLALNGVFAPMMVMGVGGALRRLADPSHYELLRKFSTWNQVAWWSAFALLGGQLVFAYNFVRTLASRPTNVQNPWNATTLEWATSSPPPHENFPAIPVVCRGPYEYSSPAVADRDFIAQNEPALEGASA